MDVMIRFFTENDEEVKNYRKVQNTVPFAEELQGYAKAVEDITGKKISYYRIDKIYKVK